MLREIRHVRQIIDEPRRRWFSDPEIDLIVWYEGDEPVGFQLTYDKTRGEKAVTWFAGRLGLQLSRVDDGEQRPGKPKATPVLTGDNQFDPWNLIGKLLKLKGELPQTLVQLVCGTLIAGRGNC